MLGSTQFEGVESWCPCRGRGGTRHQGKRKRSVPFFNPVFIIHGVLSRSWCGSWGVILSPRLAMWLAMTTASAFFVPATTALPPSRSVRRAHRVRACVHAQEAATTEVPLQSVFAALDYDKEFVPWDIGEAQPPVRKAARDGAFGSAGTTVLDCGCGAGDNANWLAARGTYVSTTRPIRPASAAQSAVWPRLAEGPGSLRHDLAREAASREPACRRPPALLSTCMP